MRSPRVLLAAHNIRPKKYLGQNFLTDPNTAKMIVNHAGPSTQDVVLEIGAGLGALTIALARCAQKVIAVEKDRQISDILKTEILVNKIENVVFLEKDILNLDVRSLAENERSRIIVVGNLPYNISSQILVRLITAREAIDRAILMFQKELARRLTAQPGCKDYGRLTVMLGYCCEIKRIGEVKASCFFPKPKVDSEVLEFRFKTRPVFSANDEAFLFRVIKAAFGNRRKTLKNALAAGDLAIDAKTAEQCLKQSEINPTRRAETLAVKEFVRLSNNLLNLY